MHAMFIDLYLHVCLLEIQKCPKWFYGKQKNFHFSVVDAHGGKDPTLSADHSLFLLIVRQEGLG